MWSPTFATGLHIACATCEVVWAEVGLQFTFWASCSVTKPTNISLDELRRYASEVEAVPQFYPWYAIPAPHVWDTVDIVIVKDLQHPFVGHPNWPRFATVEQNLSHHCLADPALCTHRYFTSEPKTRLQSKECVSGKINPASDIFGALAVCDLHRTEVLELVNILQELTRDECWHHRGLRSVNAHAVHTLGTVKNVQSYTKARLGFCFIFIRLDSISPSVSLTFRGLSTFLGLF